MWRKGNTCALLVGYKLVQPLWKTVWRFLQKLQIEWPYNLAVSKENKNTNSKRSMHHYVHCSIIYNSQDLEATYPSTDERIKKIHIHSYTGILYEQFCIVVAQPCPTLCDPIGCSLSGSSVHGVFQAIVLEWIATSFSRGSSQPRARTRVSCIVDRCFTIWATREV